MFTEYDVELIPLGVDLEDLAPFRTKFKHLITKNKCEDFHPEDLIYDPSWEVDSHQLLNLGNVRVYNYVQVLILEVATHLD